MVENASGGGLRAAADNRGQPWAILKKKKTLILKMHGVQSHEYCNNNPRLLNNHHVISAIHQCHIEYILRCR